jgi:hypothetical protein
VAVEFALQRTERGEEVRAGWEEHVYSHSMVGVIDSGLIYGATAAAG